MLQPYAPLSLPEPQPASRVKAVVVVDGQVLLLRRPSGVWDLPGGRRDEGETLEETLRREMLEEIGLAPRHPHYMQSAWRDRTNKAPVEVAFFGCKLDRGLLTSGLRLSAEHQDAQLMPPEAMSGLTMPSLYAQMATLWLQADQTSK
jgi:8-oxo-dGTP pyrophosphatase MutT (NUDIX family)